MFFVTTAYNNNNNGIPTEDSKETFRSIYYSNFQMLAFRNLHSDLFVRNIKGPTT